MKLVTIGFKLCEFILRFADFASSRTPFTADVIHPPGSRDKPLFVGGVLQDAYKESLRPPAFSAGARARYSVSLTVSQAPTLIDRDVGDEKAYGTIVKN